MRINIVWIGGLSLATLGGVGLTVVSQMAASEERAAISTVFLAILALGVIMACLGSLVRPRRLYRARSGHRSRFFGATQSSERRGRNFGQRAAYGKLDPVAERRSSRETHYRDVARLTVDEAKPARPALPKPRS